MLLRVVVVCVRGVVLVGRRVARLALDVEQRVGQEGRGAGAGAVLRHSGGGAGGVRGVGAARAVLLAVVLDMRAERRRQGHSHLRYAQLAVSCHKSNGFIILCCSDLDDLTSPRQSV